MAKGDRERVNRAIEAERATTNQQFGQFLNTATNNLAGSIQQANDLRNQLAGNLQGTYNRAGNVQLDPTVVENLRRLNRDYARSLSEAGISVDGGGGGDGGELAPAIPTDPFAASRAAFADLIASGGVNIGEMKEALPGYRRLAESGGYDPEIRAKLTGIADRLSALGPDPGIVNQIRQNVGVLQDIGQTGGIDAAPIQGDIAALRQIGLTGGIADPAIQRIRGGGVFDEFAQTGGLSPADIQNIRSRAISPIGSLYAQDVADIERSNRLLGQAAPNFGAVMARLARNRGMSLADAARDAELGIQEQVMKGRQWGAERMSSAEQALQDMLTRNRLQGLQSAGQLGMNLADAIARNRLTGATAAADQLRNLESLIIDAKFRGDSQAAQILQNMYDSIARNQLSALGGITTTQQGAEEIAQRGKIAGAQGMFGLEQAEEANRAAQAAARAYADAISAADRAADERFWADFNAQNERWIGEQMLKAAGMGMEGQLGATQQMLGLYGQAPGNVGQDYQAILNAMLGRSGSVMPTLDLQQRNIGPSVMDRIMQAAGIAAPIIGAIGGLPNFSRIQIPGRGTPNPWGGISAPYPVR